METERKRYRGYQRCSRIDYGAHSSLFSLTVCVKPRRPVFVKGPVNTGIISLLRETREEGLWGVHLYCLMPDHLHLLVRPGMKGLPDAVRMFKGRSSAWWRAHGDGGSLWQGGYFDHRIRSDESLDDKCRYILQNPVRAGLVTSAEEYPWSGTLLDG